MDDGGEVRMATDWTDERVGEDWAARTTADRATRRSVIRRPLKSGIEAAESALGGRLGGRSGGRQGGEIAQLRICHEGHSTERTTGPASTLSACCRPTGRTTGPANGLVIWTSERTELRGEFEAEDGSDCPSRLSSRVVVGQAPEAYVRVAKFGVGQDNFSRSTSGR
ncbi:hypothetical protein PF011_g32384 [Phytophthora fragariae]|uniref:Uncharacterized protein n=1 Tax=Phytophthora fragariae TaxID=53985 RepID=A0A6A3GA68_9STRA|nr:hypothetical protein PF011_g32384 [Phytophthora fragariae]